MNSYVSRYRAQLIELYGSKCWYCGIDLDESNMAADHFEPRKYGGKTDINNLRPACRLCNTVKGSVDIETFRLRKMIQMAELPKFMSTTVVRYLAEQHGFIVDLPEYTFYFEKLGEAKPKLKSVEKKTIKKFSPPTLQMVEQYCRERKNTVDPETFISFYASKGWMVGKTKMKDWKAAVVTWEKRERTAEPKSFQKPKYDGSDARTGESWQAYEQRKMRESR